MIDRHRSGRSVCVPRWTGLLLASLVFLAFRLSITQGCSTSSPDGSQYYLLSQSLLRDGRFAYDPPPATPTYTRLPGYPLFLAAVDGGLRTLNDHTRRAATANSVLDLSTGIIVALWLRDLGRSRAAVLAVLLFAVSPLTILYSVHALSESLATTLGTLELYLLFRYWRDPRARWLGLAGLVAGLAQLTRSDAVFVLPSVLVALVFARAPSRRKLAAAGTFVLAAVVAFAAWPVRNWRQFGAPHPVASEWLAQNGTPLRAGPIAWMRTWSANAPGETRFADLLVFGRPFDAKTPGVLVPTMYDSHEEYEQVAHLMTRIGGRGEIDEDADEGFRRLARTRAASQVAKVFLELPLRRVRLLLGTPDTARLRWLRISQLGWPRSFWLFPAFFALVYGAAILGTLLLSRGPSRVVALLLWAAIGARVVLHSFAVPHQVGPRYAVELVPLWVLLAAFALTYGASWSAARLRRGRGALHAA